jgi:hypothetical protein
MSVTTLRNAFCWILILIVPASMLAADSGSAMLYARGTAWLNGGSVPKTSAVFPGDLVQTKPDSVANINAAGSNVIILSDSLVKFEGTAVSIEHGSVTVATSKGLTTRARDVTVSPTSNALTEFDVSDLNGTVQIVARKGDLSVSDGNQTSTLAQGEQTTRDDSQSDQDRKKKKRRGGGAAPPAAGGGILDSPVAIGVGAAAVGGLIAWVLLQDDEPASPSKP